jgi:hypothetical protein
MSAGDSGQWSGVKGLLPAPVGSKGQPGAGRWTAVKGASGPDATLSGSAELVLEVMIMFSIRNLGGVALLLTGSTWLWLTPTFASRGVSTSGLLWTITRGLCLLTVAGFGAATWGLFARHTWWEAVALSSAVLGLVALIPYFAAAHAGGESAGAASWNAFVHVLMVAGVFALLVVPQLEGWVDRQVMGR